MSNAICAICAKPAGPIADFETAKVSHSACAMESCFVSRGHDPGSSEHYHEACEKRAKQAGEPHRLYSVDDERGVYQATMVIAYNEAHAKLLALVEMYGCPLSSVDKTHIKESLASLNPVEHEMHWF